MPGHRTLVGVLVIVLTACAGGPGPDPAAQASCGSEERPVEQSGGHVLPGQEPPVAYSSSPPTSGWHASGSVPVRVYGEHEPLSEPQHVSVLEQGGVVLSWRGLDEQDRLLLETFGREEHGRVAVTPYAALQPGQVVMTAWGFLRRCDGVDLEVVRTFVDAHHGKGPAH